MKSIYKLTILLLLLPAIVLGSNGNTKKHEKSKSIQKSFNVNSNATVSINSKYGDVNVTTWNKNKVEIDVKITIIGSDLDDVENQLEKMNVEFDASSSLVKAKTSFGSKNNGWGFWKKNKKLSYKINYTVKMPITNNVDLNNDYGGITLNNLEGRANINCNFGKMNVGDLKGNKTNINLGHCSTSTINSMKDGNVNINHSSKLEIEKATNITLNINHSTAKIEDLNSLFFNVNHGDIEIDKVVNVSGQSDHTGLKFGTIKKKLKIDSDYGSIRIRNLANNFESVDINNKYTGIQIGIPSNNNFNFIINLQNANFNRNNSNIKFNLKSMKKYEGTYGKGSSNAKITIKSSHGDVTFYENQ